jgi:hypothetical protein
MAASSAEMRRPERGEGETILHDPLTILTALRSPRVAQARTKTRRRFEDEDRVHTLADGISALATPFFHLVEVWTSAA